MAFQGIPRSLLDCVMLLLRYITQACVTQHGHVYVLLCRDAVVAGIQNGEEVFAAAKIFL